MLGVVTSARRLAAAARVHNRALLAATEPRTQPAALIHARLLSTAQPSPVLAEAAAQRESRLVKAAYSRIVNKMVTLASAKKYDVGNVEERIENVVQYLERRLGMTRLTAIRTVALHPMLTVYTVEAMERKMAWFKRNGVDEDMLKTVVRRHPMILGRSEETFEGTKQWFLDQGIDPSKIPFMFSVFPHAVSFALDSLDAKVAFLNGVGLDKTQIRRVLQRFPQVMTGSIENMTVKVDVARNLGLTDNEIVKMITVVPEFLSLSMDEVKRKIRFLDELFGEGTAVRLWVTSPRIIMCNPEQLRRTFQYLNEVVGLPRDRIAAQVGLIMRNVDRLIRPRHEYLRGINAPELVGVRWISMPQSQFEERYPDYPAFLANEFKP